MDELNLFLSLADTAQRECEDSNDSFTEKTLKIATLSKARQEVIASGGIPEELHITGHTPIKTNLVEKVLVEMDIPIGTIIRHNSNGVASVTLSTR